MDIYEARLKSQLGTFGCHGMGGSQFFGFAKNGQIVTVEELCAGISANVNSVILVECFERDKSQLWNYDDKVHMTLFEIFFRHLKYFFSFFFIEHVDFT